MKVYTGLIIASIIVNLLNSTMYIGSPGLQFILTYPTILLSSILILIAIYQIRKSSFHILITLLILTITLSTGLPLYLQDYLSSGYKMKITGQICYGIGIPLQIILLVISIKKKNLLG